MGIGNFGAIWWCLGRFWGGLLCDLARERSISGAGGTIWREGRVDLAREGAGTRGEAHGIGGGDFYAGVGLASGVLPSGTTIQPGE